MVVPSHYKLLLVEDNPADADLAQERLDMSEFRFELLSVSTLAAAFEALRRNRFDAILLDLNLPDSIGIETLRRLLARGVHGAVIVLSGTPDEELRRLTLREGAQDFLEKNDLHTRTLVRSVLYSLERHRVQAQHQQIHRLVSSNPDAVIVTDLHGVIRFVNEATINLFGRNKEELIGEELGFSLAEGQPTEVDIPRGAEHRIGEMRVVHFEWRGEEAILATIRDVTDRKKTEAALERQTRILQSVLDSIGDGVVVADEAGKILLYNPAGAEMLRRDFSYIRRDDWAEHLYLPDGVTPYPAQDTPLLCAIRGENVDQAEMVVKRPELAEPVWLSVTARPLLDESNHCRGGVAVFRDVTGKKRIEAERDRLLARLRMQIERMPLGYLLCDADFRYTAWNLTAEKMFGFTEAEVLQKTPYETIVPEQSRPLVEAIFERLRNGDMNAHGVCETMTKEGRIMTCEWYNTPLMDNTGQFLGLMSLIQDITDRKRLEEGLHQAQKLEAIGQLAGGVAHDFNNLLTVINGYSDLVLQGLPRDDSNRNLLEEIRRAGERSAALTRQLLVFSRKQVVAPQELSLNAVIQDAGKMLRRLIGEDVRVEFALRAMEDRVTADLSQLEQVLMNLAVNSRDAMTTGGQLTIETDNVELDSQFGRSHAGVQPGSYVVFAVSDTGSGIPPEVKAKMFEPFFTTKGVGKGTGLGLAVVHGIVNQAGGFIDVYSEVGVGTTFKIYLPRVESSSSSVKSQLMELPPPQGTETILLVEDEEGVRSLARRVLAHCGYTVLEASNGIEALQLARDHSGPIHLLMSDVVMPELGGRNLGEQFLAIAPQAKILYMSGYTDDAVVRHGILHEQVEFLQKPFSSAVLAHKVRQVLDRS